MERRDAVRVAIPRKMATPPNDQIPTIAARVKASTEAFCNPMMPRGTSPIDEHLIAC